MLRVLRKGVLFTLLLACPLPAAAADPVLMFLLGIAREMIFREIEARMSRPDPPPSFPETYPGTLVQPEHLRRLIDDSFMYLSEAQRAEVFEALHAELMQPKNAPNRAALIEVFAFHALQVRAAQLRLAQLSWREMEMLADEFRMETAALPEEELRRLQEVLERNLLPVPPDLNRLLLSALPQSR